MTDASSSDSGAVTVDLVIDLVCPWCWLGERYWRQAQALVPEIEVETLWRPYQLDPDLPAQGADYREYMARKFSKERAAMWTQMREFLESAGPEAGIDFNFDAIKRRPNSLDGHRIMRWARGQDLAEPAAEAMFKAFFSQGRDLSDKAVLADCAQEAGLDRAIVAGLLGGDRDREAVREEERFFRDLGVSGVPVFIFNGRFAVSGAQEPEALADAIRKAAAEPAESA